jgi:hypothetical protein
MGPVKVYDAHRDSGGCTRSPNVHAELSDAPFGAGESFSDPRTGVRVAVTGADAAGDYGVTVTRTR